MKWSRVPVSDSEVVAWSKKRIRSAIPLVPIPSFDKRIPACRMLTAISCVLRGRQIYSMRNLIRCKKRPEHVARERARQNTPKAIERRRVRHLRLKHDAKYKEDAKRRSEKYKEAHPERVRESRSRWIEKQGREYNRLYMARKRNTDQNYNIGNRIRSRIAKALRSNCASKAFKTEDAVGCSVAELRDYLKSKFTQGMSWEAFMRGEIHIDHIRPCIRFDLSIPEQQKRCFHYSNLQPLFAGDNLRKKDKELL